MNIRTTELISGTYHSDQKQIMKVHIPDFPTLHLLSAHLADRWPTKVVNLHSSRRIIMLSPMPATVNSPISKPTSFTSLVECNLPRVTQSLLGNVRLIPLTASAPFTCLCYYKVTFAIAKKFKREVCS